MADEKALDALEVVVAKLSKEMKRLVGTVHQQTTSLQRHTERLATFSSTTAQIQSSMAEIRHSLARLEQQRNQHHLRSSTNSGSIIIPSSHYRLPFTEHHPPSDFCSNPKSSAKSEVFQELEVPARQHTSGTFFPRCTKALTTIDYPLFQDENESLTASAMSKPSATVSAPPSVPQIVVSVRISEQIRPSCPDRFDRLPFPTPNSSLSSTPSPLPNITGMEKSAIHYSRTQPSTNSTLASLNKFSIPSSPFGLIQTMASLASVLVPSALHFITVRLSDTTKIPPLRDKIGGCISKNSSLVTAQISCRRLCLKGQEIELAGSENDLSNSSHPVKNTMSSWGQAFLGGKGSKSALQTEAGVPGLENTLVACLDRISKSKYGGLRTDFEALRALACKAVFSLFENLDDKSVAPTHLTIACDAYPFLLDGLITGDEQITAVARDAIKNSIENFTSSPESITTIFPTDSIDASDLRNLMAQGLPSGTSGGCTLKLLAMWESEVNGANGTLVTRSVLEPWYEKTEGKQAVELAEESLSKTILLQQISTLARNTPMEPIFRLGVKSNTSILYLDLPSNMVGSCLMGWFGVVCKGDIFRRSGQLAIGLTIGYLGSPTSFSGWNQAMLNMSTKGHWVFTALGFLLSMPLCAHSLIVGVHTAKGFRLLLRRLDNNGIHCCRSEWKIGNYKCHLILVPTLTVSLVLLLTRSGILEKKEFKSSNSEAKLWLGCLVAPLGVWIRWWFSRLNGQGLGHWGMWKWIPFGTLVANVSAACIMAALATLMREGNMKTCGTVVGGIQLGFLGCLSMVSTFIIEYNAMSQSNHTWRAYAYATITIIISVVMGTDFESKHFLLNPQTVEMEIEGIGHAPPEQASMCVTVSA